MSQQEMPQVIGVHHVGLSARDPAALAAFYHEVPDPSPEDLSDDPATTLHLVNDSMTTLVGVTPGQFLKSARIT